MKIKFALSLFILVGSLLLGSARAATAPAIPVRWLEGERGFEQALAIQKQTNLPILVWATWHECPYCGQVTGEKGSGEYSCYFRQWHTEERGAEAGENRI